MTAAARGARSSPCVRWVVAVLLVTRGLIHALVPVEIWGLGDLPGLTGTPLVDLDPTVTAIVAAAWLVALAVLVAAGCGDGSRSSASPSHSP